MEHRPNKFQFAEHRRNKVACCSLHCGSRESGISQMLPVWRAMRKARKFSLMKGQGIRILNDRKLQHASAPVQVRVMSLWPCDAATWGTVTVTVPGALPAKDTVQTIFSSAD